MYEAFTGGDGEMRVDTTRPFEHRTRWEQQTDPYLRYAELPVEYKFHCITQACMCIPQNTGCCDCDPDSWAQPVCERVAAEVAEQIVSAGLEGTISLRAGKQGDTDEHGVASYFLLPTGLLLLPVYFLILIDCHTGDTDEQGVTRIGQLRIYLQPRRRARYGVANMLMLALTPSPSSSPCTLHPHPNPTLTLTLAQVWPRCRWRAGRRWSQRRRRRSRRWPRATWSPSHSRRRSR